MTYTHELVHLILEKIMKKEKVSIVNEEKIVRCLLDEKWNVKLEKQYVADEA